MSRTAVTRSALALLFTAAAATTQVLLASSAHAVTPTCSTFKTHDGAFVPAASGGSVNCNMVRGNVSDGVARLQDTLNDCYPAELRRAGVFPLWIDRDFGGDTRTALIAVQRAVGVRADGVYGPNTRRAMKHQDVNFADPCKRVS